MDSGQAKQLLTRYLNGECSPQEQEWVEQWYQALESTGDFELSESEKKMLGIRMMENLERRIQFAPVVPISLSSRNYSKYWWVAAAVVLAFISTTWIWISRSNSIPQQAPIVMVADSIKAPDAVRATITLSNGQQILLDSLLAGNSANDHGIKMVRLASGEIVYQVNGSEIDETLLMNTMNNPRGSRVATLVLADGTKVWLNAESTVTYPIAFKGNERRVSITGEAYFEVAKAAGKPFYVVHNNNEVKVLGTHFNVNTYQEEKEVAVTLLEGSVSVTTGSANSTLLPGQQALLNNIIKVKSNVDTEQVMAWKNGLFHFEKASLQKVLSEVGRWYDMEVKFEGTPPDMQFGGEIPRSSSLGQVLKILEESDVQFRVSGKTIIVNK